MKKYNFLHYVFETFFWYLILFLSIFFIFLLANFALLFANGFILKTLDISMYILCLMYLLFIVVLSHHLLKLIFHDSKKLKKQIVNKLIFLIINYYIYFITSTIIVLILNYIYTNKFEIDFLINFICGILLIINLQIFVNQRLKMNNKSNVKFNQYIKLELFDNKKIKPKFWKFDVWKEKEKINEDIEYFGFNKGTYCFKNTKTNQIYFLYFSSKYVCLSLINKCELNTLISNLMLNFI